MNSTISTKQWVPRIFLEIKSGRHVKLTTSPIVWSGEVTLRLTVSSQSVSQYVLVSSTLVGLATRYYFLSECYCNHALLSHLRLPKSGGPGSRIYIPQEQGSPVIPPSTGLNYLENVGSIVASQPFGPPRPMPGIAQLLHLQWRSLVQLRQTYTSHYSMECTCVSPA
jgi:hypothetical protein